MIDHLFNGLTEPQREAVAHVDGPLLVLAGAGSGKTRVITRRAAHIAAVCGRADQVLAITFTNKAAGEMRDRITALGVSRGMWVCTFHSLCARLLREYAPALGMSASFTIFDESDKRSLIKMALEACELRTENWRPAEVESLISAAKNDLLTPDAFEEQAFDFTNRTIARVYRKYQELLLEQRACDFDDLLMHVALMLGTHDQIRTDLSARFRYVLIDEYQDTNHAQYLIASRLANAHRNLCATGDPDQSIYAWRGANIQNILDFEAQYPDAKVVRLEQNFRSTGAILSAASTLISHNSQRKRKELWTSGETGPAVRVWTCEDQEQEAQKVAEDILSQIDSEDGPTPGDIAVFYRTNALTRAIEEQLMHAGIPYQIARGTEFYSRQEIKDVLAYLRMIVNPADELAIERAVGSPSRGIGKTTLARIKEYAVHRGSTLGDAICSLADQRETPLGAAATKKLRPFGKLLLDLRALPQNPVAPVIEAVLQRSGLEASFSAETDSDRLENIRELVSAAKQFNQINPEATLLDWLGHVSLVSDVDGIEGGGGCVTLMTLHAAKGLEFNLVYIVGLEEDLLPHARATRGDDAQLEEERRLCFVGITRARKGLTLTHTRFRMVRGITERRVASRFLREMPEEVQTEVFETHRDRSRSHLGRANMDEFDDSAAEYYPGQCVRHEEYGEGEVISLETRGRSPYIRVHFREVGSRLLSLEHVKLYIMDGQA